MNKTNEIKKITDCEGKSFPVFSKGIVKSCKTVNGAKPENSVFCLTVLIDGKKNGFPVAGQFYMLHAVRSSVLLGRPVSIFNWRISCEEDSKIELDFLILKKGKGTQELCSLKNGDEIELLGPLGNTFPKPDFSKENSRKVCIVGGGIGIAPVSGFARTLPDKSYDFYACFKSGKYGIENLDSKAEKLIITTDDGSEGIQGMISAALNAEILKKENYKEIFACGPVPMLNYIKKIGEEAGIQTWLSMESRMACGIGVCLGCAIDTTEGKKRCCKEGPVFDGKILKFENSKITKRNPLNSDEEPDLSFDFKGVHFRNPVIASSGTFGFGKEYESVFDVNLLGGICSKGLTLEARQGNDGIRIWETPSGLMNSIGLQNPGIPHFIKNELPEMLKLKPVTIANLSGSSLETYVEGAKLLEKTSVPVIELNISCPNVAAGGAAFGMTCSAANQVVSEVRKVTSKPLIVKLTPQAQELNSVALSCIEAGADAISLCNSFQGVAIDIEKGIPVFEKVKAGFGGPAVKPIAVRLIYELYQAINSLPEKKRVPIFAIGGISNWQDTIEFIMAGANAVQIGTNTFTNPNTMIEIIDGLKSFMKKNGYKNLGEMIGIANKK